ncbi:metallophosphatase [Ruminococcus sp. AF12-5]|nr:metallophosphatase [Ruminococcus sp. AF12-5]
MQDVNTAIVMNAHSLDAERRCANMGVYITGDCHGEWQKLIYYSRCKNLTDKDFIIVCGDFGIWNDSDGYETMKLNMLSKIKPMVVFVDGNHENFDRLYSDEFETVDFCGGKAQKIRDNIYHLLRGYVFEFCGKKFFAFGGASSHDIDDGILNPDEYECWHDFMEVVNEWDKKRMMFRIKGMSWWERELPTEEEMNFGKEMLVENDNEVDFIISHCCPQQIAALFSHGMYKQDALTNYFDEIMDNTKFTRWYFGHYHDDRTIMGKFIMLYDSFERVV